MPVSPFMVHQRIISLYSQSQSNKMLENNFAIVLDKVISDCCINYFYLLMFNCHIGSSIGHILFPFSFFNLQIIIIFVAWGN